MSAFPHSFTTRRALLTAIVSAAVAVGPASAQTATDFPNKPIRIITPFSAGAGPDSLLRVLAEKMSKTLGQSVLIENKPGASGFIALEAAKKSPADGYTFVQVDDAHQALLPHLYKKIPYDINKDFDPVGTLYRTYFFVVTGSNSPLKSINEVIAAAKAKPGVLTYGSWGIGSPGHVGGAMLEGITGTQMSHVPFKETPTLFQSVSTGDVAWAFGTAGSAGPFYRGGKLKFLAVAAPKRVAGYTDVPTVAEAGGPTNFEVSAWVAVHAPKGTPPAAIAKVSEAMSKALAEPDMKERLTTFGFEPYVNTPAEITRLIAADSVRYGEIVKRAKISLD